MTSFGITLRTRRRSIQFPTGLRPTYFDKLFFVISINVYLYRFGLFQFRYTPSLTTCAFRQHPRTVRFPLLYGRIYSAPAVLHFPLLWFITGVKVFSIWNMGVRKQHEFSTNSVVTKAVIQKSKVCVSRSSPDC